MSKYELTISPDYVPEWGVVDAIRELFQNALDQQAVSAENPMFFDYEDALEELGVPGVLRIGNKKSVLDVSSLLLGKTTKAGDERTIGKFGEGYKIACLVLLRLGKTVTFYNYGKREVWRPRFVDSRRYGAKILTFFVDRAYVWERVPDNDLTVEVSGISTIDYEKICASNLHLQKLGKVESTPAGRILLDEKQKGRVYVNGLFVCSYTPYQYGYDFKPSTVKLDRDRRLVSDFDLKWLSSGMWANLASKLALDLVSENAADVAYIHNMGVPADRQKAFYDAALERFRAEYGQNAVPVSCQSDMEKVPEGWKGVLVSDGYKSLIRSSSHYSAPSAPRVDWLQALREWGEVYRDCMPGDACARFDQIVDGLAERLGEGD